MLYLYLSYHSFSLSLLFTSQESQEDIVTGYKVISEQGWENIVYPRIVTNLLTPANFCNGQDHNFLVMATNNCGMLGPPSATMLGNCGE